jgi:hypothetical protein
MSSTTSTQNSAYEKAHPHQTNRNKHATEQSGTHGKTDAHEHTTTRRTSDAERHAYADQHAKDKHTGRIHLFIYLTISYVTYLIEISDLFLFDEKYTFNITNSYIIYKMIC